MAGSAVPELDGCAYGLLAILVSNSGYSSEFLKWRQQVLKGDRVIQIKKELPLLEHGFYNNVLPP